MMKRMARPAIWQRTLDASKRQALLAVKLYNDPSDALALEGFVIHMHLAWLYYFQAKFRKEKREARIRDVRFKALRYVKVDGEHKTQSLSWFVSQDLPDVSPVRKNIEFFIQLRNKMEHRHEESTKALADLVAGESHSFLLNYEEAVVALGGDVNSLAAILRFPVFLGGFTQRGKAELLKQTQSLAADYRIFIADYYNSLDDEILTDRRYCLRITVVLEKANRSGDMLMSFINPSELDDEARKELEASIKKGALITRQRLVPVVNVGLLKPRTAWQKIELGIPFRFNSYDFTLAWKKNGCRPVNGSAMPANTNQDFCFYDEPNRSYLYTEGWVDRLIRKCQTEKGFIESVGRNPKPKANATARPPV